MNPRTVTDRVSLLGVIDWDRTIFDSLIPLPQGTSYNSYLLKGSEKIVLLDTVEPGKAYILLNQLSNIDHIDYIVSHHAEQDHSGTLPQVLERYPMATVLTSDKAKPMLLDLLQLPEDRIHVVKDGDTISLGDRTLKFYYTPWVHWPETMVSYLVEEKILFSCDFFGAHLATSNMFADVDPLVLESNKLYYSQIMMPLANFVKKNLDVVETLDIDMICPSHGPIYNKPRFVLDAYWQWVTGLPKNLVVIPYITMHHSTLHMVERLTAALGNLGVTVKPFNLETADTGQIALSLVDAATVILASPTLLGGPHPSMANIIAIAALLKPKAPFLGFIGSYGWANTTVRRVESMVEPLGKEWLPPVTHKGLPNEDTYAALDRLAETIAEKHKSIGLAG
ncbi:MAG: FprA family A-type flavoprotein [Anaerolineae bacterium]|nr:FprA family A-type flavoprotein [Anaerolineae bacterium]